MTVLHPVPLADLRTVKFSHINLAGSESTGILVVHYSIAKAVTEILDFAYRIKFPIHQAVPVDDVTYHGNDELSMADNNSSCFNDRVIMGSQKISKHALGLAVDINPLLNPYLSSKGIWYPDESHVDRSVVISGMFDSTHPVVQAFADHGFEWGGMWEWPDYHHFEWTGE